MEDPEEEDGDEDQEPEEWHGRRVSGGFRSLSADGMYTLLIAAIEVQPLQMTFSLTHIKPSIYLVHQFLKSQRGGIFCDG